MVEPVVVVIVTTIVVVILTALILNLLLLARNRRLQSNAILLKVQAEYEQTILQTQIEVTEETLSEISRDLHDDVGQMLTFAIMQINHLQRKGDELHGNDLEEIGDTLKSSLQSIRNISRYLNPEFLQSIGFNEALFRLCERIKQQAKIDVVVSTSNEVSWQNTKHEMVVFRIIQELISNTVKHAQASKISIIIAKNSNSIILEYSDNGKGMAKDSDSNGLGFLNIKKRTAQIGGTLDIEATAKNGFNVKFNFPIN